MNKRIGTISKIIISFILELGVIIVPTVNTFALDSSSSCLLAREHVTHTTFFGDVQDSGDGCSIFRILDLILTIFGGLVALGSVVGIAIVGVQYMGSKQDEQMATKAKRRILEIIVGVAIYAAMHAGAIFLLRSDAFGLVNQCGGG